MAARTPKTPLVAADTNVLLDLAFKDDDIWQCLETLKARRPAPRFIVTPTVLQELAHLYMSGSTPEKRAAAATALRFLISWGFGPLNLLAVGHGIVERIGDEIRRLGLIPDSERHDSFVIAEAALCEADMLITPDAQLYDPLFKEQKRTADQRR